MIYYSQYGEDSILSQFFNEINGFYVDVGALDGIHLSNTYLFEQRGWTGICIEAHPEIYQECVKNRPLSTVIHTAAGDKNGLCTFSANHRGSFSKISKTDATKNNIKYVKGNSEGTIISTVTTLDTIFEYCDVQPGFELLSIDVDGSEKYTLGGLTIDRYKPRVIILEISSLGKFVKEWVQKNGYHIAKTTESNIICCKDKSDALEIDSITVVGKRSDRIRNIDKK